MSRADEIFIQNCRDILDNGVWDTDREVRPRWEDGTPAHTVKKFCIVNRYDLSKELTTFMSSARASGMPGPMRTARSARPTAISWA